MSEHMLFDADPLNGSVWDWIKRKRLNRFFNGNPRGTSITSLHLINQDVGGIILTGAGTFSAPHLGDLLMTLQRI